MAKDNKEDNFGTIYGNYEYKILNLNIENDNTNNSDPKADSQRLKGMLSPEFIKEQFPEKYLKKTGNSFPEQIANLLNTFGNEGWELKTIEKLAGYLLFIFMRKVTGNKNKGGKSNSLRENILEYKKLFDDKLINEKEFEILKKKTLGL
tara:strand:+ start:201 stop:647 length:447 start_codon:yes stop_codon:yes gene_type:complete